MITLYCGPGDNRQPPLLQRFEQPLLQGGEYPWRRPAVAAALVAEPRGLDCLRDVGFVYPHAMVLTAPP